MIKVYWIHQDLEETISSDEDVLLEDKLNMLPDGHRKYEVKLIKG